MDQADGVMAAVRDVLGDAVLGGYLFGSAVAGGLRPTSDICTQGSSRPRNVPMAADARRSVSRLTLTAQPAMRP